MQKEIVNPKTEAKTPLTFGHAKALSLIKEYPIEQKALFNKIVHEEFVPAEDAMILARDIRDSKNKKPVLKSMTFKYQDDRDLLKQLRAMVKTLNSQVMT